MILSLLVAGWLVLAGQAKGGTVFEGTLESVLSRLLKEKGLKVDFDVALPALPTSSASIAPGATVSW